MVVEFAPCHHLLLLNLTLFDQCRSVAPYGAVRYAKKTLYVLGRKETKN